MSWKTAKQAKPCNTFPGVWAAIHGCTGTGSAWRYTTGHFGRPTSEYACPTCRAARDAEATMTAPQLRQHLADVQRAAGVADYRVAEVIWQDGRPVLTGKVCPHLAREAADNALYQYGAGSNPLHVIAALRVLHAAGGDVKALIAQHRLRAAAVEELRAAWRAF